MSIGASSIVLPILALGLTGCYAWQQPENEYTSGAPYMAERLDMPTNGRAHASDARRANAQRCATTPVRVNNTGVAASGLTEAALLLSRGDLIRISAPSDEAPTGTYKIDSDMTVALDQIGKFPVNGRTVQQLETDLSARLVARGIFRPGHARVTVRLLDRAPVRVNVSGAIFAPGQVVVNERPPQQTDTVRQTASGDDAIGRSLGNALSRAGGVRPDADIQHIEVTHAGQKQSVDLSGLLEGDTSNDILLIDGDKVRVPSRDCFQAQLARPTPITPQGVRVYLSNLTIPTNNNAGAAIGHDSGSLPYGTRLLQALVSANCVGGTQTTNADRWAVLISTKPSDGESEVIERRIESLVRRSDRDAFNPILLPDDAIACYDSAVTNVRDVLHTLSDTALSLSLGTALGGL
jgi:protein involved in polysaccharide export with SLBB domain